MIPTRDGARLSCQLARPADGAGPWPVLFTMRYGGDGRDQGSVEERGRMAAEGYAVGFVLFRGCHDSEGRYEGYHTLARDAYDACEWLAKQPWCDGQVATFGGSQGGTAQNFLAGQAPPSLVCQYNCDTGLSMYHEAFRHGGGGQRGPAAFGGGELGAEASPHFDKDHRSEIQAEWKEHPFYDEYWAVEDSTQHLGKMNVPSCSVGSWFDFMCQGSAASFVGRQRLGGPASRGSQTMVIGPWLHGGPKETSIGELELPPQAKFPQGGFKEHMSQYFAHHLKGVPMQETAVVQYYVMGAVGEEGAPGNEWRGAPDWPIPACPTKYFLAEGGSLALDCPADGGTDIVADPADRADNGSGSVAFQGARDARHFESQAPRVHTFTSSVLSEPVEWTGAVHAVMHATVGAEDCDLIVRVSDVYPDGRSILIAECHRRASFRAGLDQPPTPLAVGETCEVTFRVGWMSQIFAAGHCIRVTVSCTAFPLYETGGSGHSPGGGPAHGDHTDGTAESIGRVVHTLRHGGAHASHVLAPLIPAGDASSCVDVSGAFVADLARGAFPA